jgi:hypothetical protein
MQSSAETLHRGINSFLSPLRKNDLYSIASQNDQSGSQGSLWARRTLNTSSYLPPVAAVLSATTSIPPALGSL